MADFKDKEPVYFKDGYLAINLGYYPYYDSPVINSRIKHLEDIRRMFLEKTGIKVKTDYLMISVIAQSRRFKNMTVVYMEVEEKDVPPSIQRIDKSFGEFVAW